MTTYNVDVVDPYNRWSDLEVVRAVSPVRAATAQDALRIAAKRAKRLILNEPSYGPELVPFEVEILDRITGDQLEWGSFSVLRGEE